MRCAAPSARSRANSSRTHDAISNSFMRRQLHSVEMMVNCTSALRIRNVCLSQRAAASCPPSSVGHSADTICSLVRSLLRAKASRSHSATTMLPCWQLARKASMMTMVRSGHVWIFSVLADHTTLSQLPCAHSQANHFFRHVRTCSADSGMCANR